MSEAEALFCLLGPPALDLLIVPFLSQGTAVQSITVAPGRRKAGRPRIHTGSAARQRTYRLRNARRRKKPVRDPNIGLTPPTSDSRLEWNRYLAANGLSVSRGRFMEGAPHGKGEIVSGGYGTDKVAAVAAAGMFASGLHQEDGYHARRSRCDGAAPASNGDEPGDNESPATPSFKGVTTWLGRIS